MCGRYTLTRSAEALGRALEREVGPGLTLPAYNASPGRQLPVVLDVDPARIVPASWGIHAASGSTADRLLVNARAETAHLRPAFRDSFRRRRCLVLADGFYEWQGKGTEKQPYRFTLVDEGVFAFAGLWSGEESPAYVVLTTRPNALTAPVHERMPVLLDRDAWPGWLDREADVGRLFEPFPEARMKGYPVSRAVNFSANEGPGLIEPVELRGLARGQGSPTTSKGGDW
jgi:putative SOS response-associated peptidase YedK